MDRLDGGWDTHGQNVALVERLAEVRVIDPQIPSHGVDLHALGSREKVDGVLHVVQQRENIIG